MFTKTQTETKLDAEINSLLDKLKETEKDSEDYAKLLERISKLHKLKTEENGTTIENIVKMHEMESKNRMKQISPDTVLIVAANIFGILWLTRYEKDHVINSKALGFVMKNR